MFLAGASLAWNANGFDEKLLQPVLSRDVFGDSTGRIAGAALKLGFVHRLLKAKVQNETPLGTVIAAPPVEERELFCRNGSNWFKKIPAARIRATLRKIERQQALLSSGVSEERRHLGKLKSAALYRVAATNIRALELDLATRMAAQSCKFMLWQQAVATGKASEAKRLAQIGIRELQKLDKEFNRYWASRNKATPKHCSAFLRWRINDYRRSLAQ
jgi:hypothetical protein